MNKRWVVLIVVLVLIIVGLVGYLVSQGGKGEKEKLANYTEGTDKYTSFSKSVVVAYDVLKGETELEYTIDPGLLELGMLKMDVSLLNKSQNLIEQTEAVLRIIDSKGSVLLEKYAVFFNIKPGVAVKSSFGITDLNKLAGEVKKITLTLWKVWGETTISSTPAPTTTTKTTITPTLTQSSPGQTVKDFYQAWIDGRYEDMLNYVSSADIKKMSSYPSWKQLWIEMQVKTYKTHPIERIEILKEDEGAPKDARGNVSYIVYYKDKNTEELGIFLVKEESGWKVIL